MAAMLRKDFYDLMTDLKSQYASHRHMDGWLFVCEYYYKRFGNLSEKFFMAVVLEAHSRHPASFPTCEQIEDVIVRIKPPITERML